MTAFVTRILLVVALIPLIVGAMQIVSDLDQGDRVSQFTDLNGPALWTTEPVRIDAALQRYDRLPPIAVASSDVEAPVRSEVETVAASKVGDESETAAASTAANPDAVAWCQQRYKSYEPADNTYQPYGGGVRRACIAPFALGNMTAMAVHAPAPSESSHVHWCATRYSSYRAEDNTYQPFSGQRRTCVSPFDRSAPQQTAGL
jgi:hypothetical protein